MKPKEVTSDHAFKLGDLIPPYATIPDEFKRGHTHWNKLFNQMFFSGCKRSEFVAKEGIDEKKAIIHMRTIAQSWEPNHEHKEAACAYLMSLWFVEPKQ